jgi:hypothetical protein
VLVEGRLADTEPSGESGCRESGETDLVREDGRFLCDDVSRESGPRHADP